MNSKTGMKKLRNCLETISENRLFKKIKIKNNFLTQKGVYVLTEKSFFKICSQNKLFSRTNMHTHTTHKQFRMSSKAGMKKLRMCLETIFEHRFLFYKIKTNF